MSWQAAILALFCYVTFVTSCLARPSQSLPNLSSAFLIIIKMVEIPAAVAALPLFATLPALSAIVAEHRGAIPLPISAAVQVEVNQLAAQVFFDYSVPVATKQAVIALKTMVDLAAAGTSLC